MSKTAIASDVTIEAGDWRRRLPEAEGLARRAIEAAAAGFELGAGAEVSVLLTDDRHIQALNRDWRGKDKPTNVLSFPGEDAEAEQPDGAPLLLGDIVVALETSEREAQDQQKPLADHFSHLVVHGMLHLLGYDHETQAEADEMEPLEIEVLAGLGVTSPYPDRN